MASQPMAALFLLGAPPGTSRGRRFCAGCTRAQEEKEKTIRRQIRVYASPGYSKHVAGTFQYPVGSCSSPSRPTVDFPRLARKDLAPQLCVGATSHGRWTFVSSRKRDIFKNKTTKQQHFLPSRECSLTWPNVTAKRVSPHACRCSSESESRSRASRLVIWTAHAAVCSASP